MTFFDRRTFARLPLSALAALLLFGSVPVLAQQPTDLTSASVSPSSASGIRPPSGIGLQDEDRVRLLREARALYAFNEFPDRPSDYDPFYETFKTAGLAAFRAAFDPASTREELTAAAQSVHDFPQYELYAGVYNVPVDTILFEQELQLRLYEEFGSEPGQRTEADAERFMQQIALMRDQLYPLVSRDYWNPDVWPIFWAYLNAKADFEDLRGGRADLFAQTFRYRTDVLNRTVDGRLSPAQTAGFDAAVRELETRLATFGAPEAIEAAFAGVRAAYASLPESGTPAAGLSADLAAARALLDLPRGIRSGQYPASAFGALRRAINEAQRALEKVGTDARLAQARSALASAVSAFRAKQKP
ncbi:MULTISPECIES: hypothetical protein [Saccharibacillus]|uniref:hypothetical protein n=1 Tax=Saccharibacillus TaxID=456492 RepID=UPI00123AFFB7|nr:hypothetical protein [Saccharibacillus sp. WB 17]MWJ30246.1 hypothetical protein [Saccharibacillus sp. WB 17]